MLQLFIFIDRQTGRAIANNIALRQVVIQNASIREIIGV